MQTFHSGLHSSFEAFTQTLLLGVCTSLLVAVGFSELSTRESHVSSAAPAELTGLPHVFAATEGRAEWQATAPLAQPATAFGTAEARAEWASVMPHAPRD